MCFFRDDAGSEVAEGLDLFISLFHSAHHMDLIQIKTHLDLFHHQYDQEEDIERLRNILKKALAEEICKSDLDDENKLFFETCLQEIRSWLSTVDTGFPCCLIGCKFTGDRHRNYVAHIRKDHPNAQNIVCNFKRKCRRSFLSVTGLIGHLKEDHSRITRPIEEASDTQARVVDIPCKCDRESCGGMNFMNLRELMKHYNSYHGNENRECMFENCNLIFSAFAPRSAMNHIRKKHKNTGNLNLKSRYRINLNPGISVCGFSEGPDLSEVNNDAIGDIEDGDVYEENDFDTLEDNYESVDSEENNNEHYLAYFSDFLSRMAFIKFVPQTTIQDICEEFIINTKKSLKRQENLLRRSLQSCDNCAVEDIVKELFEKDPFLQAQVQLNSEYKRKMFVQASPNYVHPTEILLNKSDVQAGSKKEVYHYISVVDSVRILTMDQTFLNMRAQTKVHSDDKIRDLKDGIVFKKNDYFKRNPDAFSIILYSDAVEMQNPLGAARGTYKIVFVYFTLCEIDKSQRSQIDHLQLALAFREKLLKKYSLATIFKPLIDDLKSLEQGIEVQFPSRRLKCGVACYVSDNLEASLVGGFSANFSSSDICRVCHIQHKDLVDQAHEAAEFWTVEEYDDICDSLVEDMEVREDSVNIVVEAQNLFTEYVSESDENDSSPDSSDESESETVGTRGLKSRCPLNVLRSFHAVTGFPLDIMHDLFEGNFNCCSA